MSEAPQDPLIAEQISYYKARAAEYDDWWLRRGKYDAGPEFARYWAEEIERAYRWVSEHPPCGRVLEVAAGTGNWSAIIEPMAAELTVMDSSAEALYICANKLTRAGTRQVVANIFDWEPPQLYDTVFFSFWLSHVTEALWEPFWRQVDAALAPNGRFMLIENLDPLDRSRRVPEAYWQLGEQDRVGDRRDVRVRSTADGRQFRVAKRYWSRSSLKSALDSLGWDVEVAQTEFAFLCAHGTKR